MRTFLAVLLLATVLAQPAAATNKASADCVCPIDKTQFKTRVVVSYSTSGGDDEWRPMTLGDDVIDCWVHTCPTCNFSATGRYFARPGHGSGEPGAALTEAQVKAVRAALAANKQLAPPRRLLPVEKVEAAIVCAMAAGAPARELLSLQFLAAWRCDDFGLPERATEHRREALALCRKIIGDRNAESVPRLEAMFRAAVLSRGLGDIDGAKKLFADLAEAAPKCLPAIAVAIEAEQSKAKAAEAKGGDAAAEATPHWEKVDELTEAQEWLSGLGPTIRQQLLKTRMMVAGEAGARDMAEAGGLQEKLVFVELHAASKDKQTIEAIRRFGQKPLGDGPDPGAPPAEQEKWRQAEEEAKDKIQDLCFTYGPPRFFLKGTEDDAESRPASQPAGPAVADSIRRVAELRGLKRQLTDPENGELSTALAALAESRDRRAQKAFWADLNEQPGWYARTHFQFHWGGVLGRPLSRRGVRNAASLLDRSLQRLREGTLDAAVVTHLLDWLGGTLPEERRKPLMRQALQAEDSRVRTVAARFLVLDGDASGKGVLIENARRHPELVDLSDLSIVGRRLAGAVGPADYERLDRLREEFAKASLSDPPVWLMVALVKSDPRRGGVSFDLWFERLVKECEEEAANPRGIVVYADLFASEIMLDRVLRAAEAIQTARTHDAIVRLLVNCGSYSDISAILSFLTIWSPDGYGDALASLLDRPLMVEQQLALIELSATVEIPGIRDALQRWSRSADAELAAAAKEALAGKDKATQ